MGRILYKCLSAVISNLSVLFCTGLAASLAKQEKHQAAFIALMSYFIYLTAGNVTLAELGLLAQARPACWASRPWIPACSAACCWAC